MADDLDLIAAIYDTILDPAGWQDVVRRIAEATKSVAGGIFLRLADAAQLSAMHNVDPFYANAFVETWYKHNPLDVVSAALVPGELRSCIDITQSDTYRASPFFNEYIRPQGWDDAVGVCLLRGHNSSGYLVVHRSPDAIWVEPPEWHFLETLAPHPKRAAEIHQLLAREQAAKESLGAAVAAAGFAAFLLTKDCRVHFANPKAEELLRRGAGLRCANGRLCAATHVLTERLNALVRVASAVKEAEGGTLELACGEGRPAPTAYVLPLAANRTASIFDIERPAAALFILDPAANLRAEIERFAARYGLTEAETSVLREILGRKGLRAAAARLKITESTAHTHAQRIFAKTGTARQTELIRQYFGSNFPAPSGGV